ncbi:MAG: C-terminal binding protein [Planctomycetes bacterium]|nr:C-terminal binding protein [Planctomycetota bacterium]
MPATFRVLITDRAWPDSDLEREILREVGAEVIEAPSGDETTLKELACDVDAIATCWAKVTSDVIRSAPRCKIVARLGIGLDNICVKTATELGIPVTNVPDYCIPEVSDHTLALILACARNIAFFHHRTKQQEYHLQAGPPMARMEGRVLGLIGFGRIGRAVFRKATALGLQVKAYSLSGNNYETGCCMVSLDALLEQSDFVSLHLPLTDRSQHLMRLPQFQRMKQGAFLINTSRGALIDHDALWKALQDNEIAGAALDVFDPEPPDLSQPLFQDERVIVTPHVAFISEESVTELRRRTARQIVQALRGLQPENVVNPQVYERSI